MDSIKRKRMSDRIYRIIKIKVPLASGYLAAGEKNHINHVSKKEIKNRIHSILSALMGENITVNMLP
jgi:hypothetical protein